MHKTRYAVVGVRNFAEAHINNIKNVEKEGLAKLAAVVVRDQVENAEKVAELKRDGVKIFQSYEELLEEGKDLIDVISLPTPIHSHAEMAIKGMRHGYDILLEKPPTATIDELDYLIKVQKETGKMCAVGFQFIHSRSIRKLKELIVAGKLGEIKETACKGCWIRYKSYYDRTAWAGRSVWNGRIILDGSLQNALAHFLNNMLFLASPNSDESAELKTIRAELYRAHTYIKAEDTTCLEAETLNGTKIYFYVTLAPEQNQDPYIEITGTKGKAYWHYNEKTVVEFNNGEKMEFDNEGVDPWEEVIRVAAKVHQGIIAKPYSTLENSRNFVIAVNGAYDSAKKVRPIPEKYVKEFTTADNEFKTELQDIEEIIGRAFQERKLFSDLGVEWAQKTETVNVEGYHEFNPFQ